MPPKVGKVRPETTDAVSEVAVVLDAVVPLKDGDGESFESRVGFGCMSW